MAKSKYIALRVDDALKARIEAAALAEGRNVSNWLVVKIRAVLDGADKQAKQVSRKRGRD